MLDITNEPSSALTDCLLTIDGLGAKAKKKCLDELLKRERAGADKEVAKLTRILEIERHAAHHFCPDCRDKVKEEPCLRCQVQALKSKLERATFAGVDLATDWVDEDVGGPGVYDHPAGVMSYQRLADEVDPEEERREQPRDLARRYYEDTEEYDRTVCTGPIVNGGIMPADGAECALVSAHARRLDSEFAVKAERLGFSYDEWANARHAYAHARRV